MSDLAMRRVGNSRLGWVYLVLGILCLGYGLISWELDVSSYRVLVGIVGGGALVLFASSDVNVRRHARKLFTMSEPERNQAYVEIDRDKRRVRFKLNPADRGWLILNPVSSLMLGTLVVLELRDGASPFLVPWAFGLVAMQTTLMILNRKIAYEEVQL